MEIVKQDQEWMPIVGYPNYMVSDLGNVVSVKFFGKCNYSKILKPKPTQKGYLRVSLCSLGKIKDHYIHRLVAAAFIPNPMSLPEVNHKDFDNGNNKKLNLEWSTHQSNMKHAHNAGRIVFSDACKAVISQKRKEYWRRQNLIN